MTREHDRRATVAILAMTLILVGASVLAFSTSTDDTAVADAAAPSVPEFVVECTWSHRAADDPIVHPGHAGASHMHDFFGSTETSAVSTAESLLETPSSCQTHAADTAAYWAPTLYLHDEAVEPSRLFAYYRRPIVVDPGSIQPFRWVWRSSPVTRRQPSHSRRRWSLGIAVHRRNSRRDRSRVHVPRP